MRKILNFLSLLSVLLACSAHQLKPRKLSDANKHELPYPKTFLSDLSDTEIQACNEFQSFAMEKCWDEIEIKDSGTLSLSRPGEQFTLIEDGILAAKVAKLYSQVSGARKGLWRHARIDRLMKSTGGYGYDYWLLPSEIEVGEDMGPGSDLRVIKAPFKLVDWRSFRGKATLCGTELRLPLLLVDVETACGVKANNFQEVVIKKAHGSLRIVFDRSATDMAPGWESRMKAGGVIFEL